MTTTNPTGLKYNYILVVHPNTTKEEITVRKTDRYRVVSEALKLQKMGTPYEIQKWNGNEYVRDHTGHEQVETRPGIIAANAAKHGKTVSNSNGTSVDKAFIEQLNQLAEACKALASAERKGTNNARTRMDWASEVLTTLEASGIDSEDLRDLFESTFPEEEGA